MSENDNLDRIKEGDRTGTRTAGSDNLDSARDVDGNSVRQAQRKNSNIFKSMTDIPGLNSAAAEKFTLTDGNKVVSKTEPVDNSPAAVARRDLEKLVPPGSNVHIDFQRKNGQLAYTVDGGSTQDNARISNLISNQQDAFWQHMEKAVPASGHHRFDFSSRANDTKAPVPHLKPDTPHMDAGNVATDIPPAQKKSPEEIVKQQLGKHLPEGLPVTITMKNGGPYLSWQGNITPEQQQEIRKALADPQVADSLNKVAHLHPGFTFKTSHAPEQNRPPQTDTHKVTYTPGDYLKGGADEHALKGDATYLSAGAQATDRVAENPYWTGNGRVELGGKPVDVALNPTQLNKHGDTRVRAVLRQGTGDISEVGGLIRPDANGNCSYYIDSYIDKNLPHIAPAGRYFQIIPLNKSRADGSYQY
jgi:hypothetical protein